MTRKRKAAVAALVTAAFIPAGLSSVANTAARQAPDGSRVVIVAELFTSEGCSSCPPADALLRQLISTQPIAGAEIIALSNHVDYWNNLGWRDPFSSPIFSARQSSYHAAIFRSNQIYTPQLVVDGSLETVGSDAGAVRRTILNAAREPKGAVSVSAARGDGPIAEITIAARLPADVRRTGAAEVLIAVTEDGLTSRVQRGENRGRTLTHDAVARTLVSAGPVTSEQRDVDLSTTITLDSGWRPASLRIVALVQETASRRIIAAGCSTFPAR